MVSVLRLVLAFGGPVCGSLGSRDDERGGDSQNIARIKVECDRI
jgi:hypothetical protein